MSWNRLRKEKAPYTLSVLALHVHMFPRQTQSLNECYRRTLTRCKWHAYNAHAHPRAAGWKWSVSPKRRFDLVPLVFFGWRKWVMSVGEESGTSKLKELISTTNVGITQILPLRWHPNQARVLPCLMCLWCNTIYTCSKSNRSCDCPILSQPRQLERRLGIH